MEYAIVQNTANSTNNARNVINAQIRTVKNNIRRTEIKLTIAIEWLMGDLQHTLNLLAVSSGSGRVQIDSKGIVRGKGPNIDTIVKELNDQQHELEHLNAMKQRITQ